MKYIKSQDKCAHWLTGRPIFCGVGFRVYFSREFHDKTIDFSLNQKYEDNYSVRGERENNRT